MAGEDDFCPGDLRRNRQRGDVAGERVAHTSRAGFAFEFGSGDHLGLGGDDERVGGRALGNRAVRSLDRLGNRAVAMPVPLAFAWCAVGAEGVAARAAVRLVSSVAVHDSDSGHVTVVATIDFDGMRIDDGGLEAAERSDSDDIARLGVRERLEDFVGQALDGVGAVAGAVGAERVAALAAVEFGAVVEVERDVGEAERRVDGRAAASGAVVLVLGEAVAADHLAGSVDVKLLVRVEERQSDAGAASPQRGVSLVKARVLRRRGAADGVTGKHQVERGDRVRENERAVRDILGDFDPDFAGGAVGAGSGLGECLHEVEEVDRASDKVRSLACLAIALGTRVAVLVTVSRVTLAAVASVAAVGGVAAVAAPDALLRGVVDIDIDWIEAVLAVAAVAGGAGADAEAALAADDLDAAGDGKRGSLAFVGDALDAEAALAAVAVDFDALDSLDGARTAVAALHRAGAGKRESRAAGDTDAALASRAPARAVRAFNHHFVVRRAAQNERDRLDGVGLVFEDFLLLFLVAGVDIVAGVDYVLVERNERRAFELAGDIDEHAARAGAKRLEGVVGEYEVDERIELGEVGDDERIVRVDAVALASGDAGADRDGAFVGREVDGDSRRAFAGRAGCGGIAAVAAFERHGILERDRAGEVGRERDGDRARAAVGLGVVGDGGVAVAAADRAFADEDEVGVAHERDGWLAVAVAINSVGAVDFLAVELDGERGDVRRDKNAVEVVGDFLEVDGDGVREVVVRKFGERVEVLDVVRVLRGAAAGLALFAVCRGLSGDVRGGRALAGCAGGAVGGGAAGVAALDDGRAVDDERAGRGDARAAVAAVGDVLVGVAAVAAGDGHAVGDGDGFRIAGRGLDARAAVAAASRAVAARERACRRGGVDDGDGGVEAGRERERGSARLALGRAVGAADSVAVHVKHQIRDVRGNRNRLVVVVAREDEPEGCAVLEEFVERGLRQVFDGGGDVRACGSALAGLAVLAVFGFALGIVGGGAFAALAGRAVGAGVAGETALHDGRRDDRHLAGAVNAGAAVTSRAGALGVTAVAADDARRLVERIRRVLARLVLAGDDYLGRAGCDGRAAILAVAVRGGRARAGAA